MDFIVKKTDFLRELQYAQGVVEKKNTIPILSNLLLETTGTSVKVTATDLDVSIQCSCPAQVKVSGAATVSARKLFEIIRLLPEADIHIKSSEREWIQIVCERSKFKLAGLGKENFPDIPSQNGKGILLPVVTLRYMITHSIFAITQEESRYTLNGALLLIRPNGLTMVATDGHRLALVTRNEEMVGVNTEVRILVPKKALVELTKLTGEGTTGSVKFTNTENHLFFEVEKRLLVSRVLAGQFPNYEMVIPRDNDKKVVMTRNEFLDALRRAAVVADEQSRVVRLSIKAGQVDISSTHTDVGEAREIVVADYEGSIIEIGFNAQYLLDFLNVLETERVSFELRDAETQGLLQPTNHSEYIYNYIVMPMKI
ncbi:MAG: DNA polymerase III subunit beta [Acidobacteria bacterium]|nr:DNA polymerase III subunit beta [Acidobacteriota bacterium]